MSRYTKGTDIPSSDVVDPEWGIDDGDIDNAIIIYTSEEDRDDLLKVLNGQKIVGLWAIWSYNDGSAGDKYLGGPVLEILPNGSAKIGAGGGGTVHKPETYMPEDKASELVKESEELLATTHKNMTKARQQHLVLFSALREKFNLKGTDSE